jgi:hypothetical protein
MQRRRFFKWSLSTAIPLVVPRWAWAQPAPFTREAAATLRDVAAVVLPSSLGTSGIDDVVDQFTRWVRNYKAGAQMSAGYGFTRIRTVPPNPSTQYAQQLQELEAAARARGAASLGKLDPAARRTLVESAVRAAGITDMPRRPDGKHVAADIMSFFFFSSDGEDYLYAAAIQRDACRGLADSGQRPAPLR